MLKRIGLAAVMVLIGTLQAFGAEPPPTFLEHLDKSDKTALFIPDPLPNVQRVLTNPKLNQLWDNGKLLTFIRAAEPDTPLPSLQVVWAMILRNARWVPREIAIGVPESTWQDLDHLVRGVMLMNLNLRAREGASAEDRAELRKELTAAMNAFHTPMMRIWVEFRAEDDAAELFALVRDQMKGVAAGSPILKVTADETTLRASVAMADVFPDREGYIRVLRRLGVVDDVEDPAAGELADAVAKLSMDSSLQRDGAGLLLTIGESEQTKALSEADLGPLFSADARTIMFGCWDTESMIKVAQGWDEMIERWSSSSYAPQEKDAKALLNSVKLLSHQLRGTSPRGVARIWSTANGVGFRVQQEGVETAAPLAKSPVLRLIPADCGAFGAETFASLSGGLGSTLQEAMLRLSREEAKDRSRARATEKRTGRKPELEPEIYSAYDVHFARFHKYVTEDAAGTFEPGLGAIIGADGVLKHVEVGSPTDPTDRFVGTDLPMIEFALIGVPKDAEQGRKYFAEMYDALVEGIVSAANEHRGEKPPIVKPAPPLLVERDLGLGVKTFTFDGRWLTELAKDEIKLAVEGDLFPHIFAHADTLVFSTSPRLSRRMLEAAKTDSAAKLPALASDQRGTVTAYTKFDGKIATAITSQVGVWGEAIIKQFEEDEPEKSAKDFAQIMAGVGEFVALLEGWDSLSWQDGDRIYTGGNVKFAVDKK